MTAVWSRVRESLERHGSLAMVTVAAARGSAPREAGARLIVNPDGTFTGTIGGGALEWRAIALAQAALAEPGASRASLRSFALGPELGQCCGGRVELIVELIGAEGLPAVAELARREAAGPFATRGRLSANRGVSREIVEESGIGPGAATFAGGVLSEGFGDDRRPLMLFGAGHVGRALALALAPLPFRVTWLDPRPDAFPAYVPANVTTAPLGEPARALADAADGSFVLAMTHSHPLDLAVVEAALAAGRFPYVGLIGSGSKRARFEKRLAAGGIAAERIALLVCPIGIAGIRSKAPAAIAAATAADLLARDEALRAAAGGATDTGVPERQRGRG